MSELQGVVVEDIIIKASYLGSHEELFYVYKALVDTGLMADAEFWRIRPDELEMERVSFRNRRGIIVQNQTRYALGAYLKEQLINAVPLLKKNVCASKEEAKVWEEFFSSKTFGDGTKTSSLFDPHSSPQADDDFMQEAEYIMHKLNTLAASENDRFEGFGNQEEEYFEEPKITCTLMHEINLSSVQQVPPLGNYKNIQAVHSEIIIPDLKEDFCEDYERANVVESLATEVGQKIYKGPLCITLEDSKEPENIPPLNTLAPIPSTELILEENKNNNEKSVNLDIPHKDQVQILAQTVIEVLKHFWSSVPPMTVEKRQIATSMINILVSLEKDYQHWRVRISLKDQIQIDQVMGVSIWEPVKRARQVYQDVTSKK